MRDNDDPSPKHDLAPALSWGGLRFGPWSFGSAAMTLAGTVVVISILSSLSAGRRPDQYQFPMEAVYGGAFAGIAMVYLLDCGNRFLALAGVDKLRFLALMAAAAVVGVAVPAILSLPGSA